MKILHIIPGMDPKMGGVVQAVATMIKTLSSMGINNDLASLDAPGDKVVTMYPFVIHALGPGRGPWFYNPALTRWLDDHLLDYDVVIAHGLWQYHTYALNSSARKMKRQLAKSKNNSLKMPKVYVMPHGMLDPYFQKAKGRRLKAIRNYIFWKLIERRVINEADGLLFTCEEECLLAKHTFTPYSPKKESIVGLAVEEPPVYNPNMSSAFNKKSSELKQPYFLILSRIHEKKGIDLMLEAYEYTLREKISNDRDNLPNIVVAGPGIETGFGNKLLEKVANNKYLKGRVHFTGMLMGDEKWGAFYGCEAFILLSHQENFGISIVEAMACGKPVLISNKINIWREIKNAESGFIEEDTVNGGIKVLSSWMKLQEEDKRTIIQKARMGYENYFGTSRFGQQLINVFQN